MLPHLRLPRASQEIKRSRDQEVKRSGVESRLFGVRASDPVTLLAVSASIVALAICASLVPALRAARVDPVQSLRAE
jgi:hypothetical protein